MAEKSSAKQTVAKSAPAAAGATRKKRTAPRLEQVDGRNMNVVAQDVDQLRDLLGTQARAIGNGIFVAALAVLGVNGKSRRLPASSRLARIAQTCFGRSVTCLLLILDMQLGN